MSHVSIRKKMGNKIVSVHNIIGTMFTTFKVYEPSGAFGNHTAITTFNEEGKDKWYGEVCSRRLPKTLQDMPRGGERFEKVYNFINKNYEEGYEVIMRAFPELSQYVTKKRHGEIEMWDEKGFEHFIKLTNELKV